MFVEHFEEYPEFNEIFGLGSEFYKMNLKEVIFSDDGRLDDTYYTQPILMLASFSLFKIWHKRGCALPKVSCGHSLGEISSLLCAGIISLPDALKFIKFRASFMIESKGEKKNKNDSSTWSKSITSRRGYPRTQKLIFRGGKYKFATSGCNCWKC
jgi:malonyl CoA-acyl carrier protein transacylase